MILTNDTAREAPSRSNTIETVVDVGRPKVLKRSSSTTSAIITARKIVTNSGMVKNPGLKIPLRATSIMPLENVTPARMPKLATIMITCCGAAREPTAEFKKLTASLLTPTIKSIKARTNSTASAKT